MKSLRVELAKTTPDRKTAFAIALKIENSAGEQHFQKVMGTPSDSKVVQILQELWEDDINHHARIEKYMQEVGEAVQMT